MKNQTLKSIFLLCILHFAFCISSNAQIVYTDVNPDDTISCSPSPCSVNYNLDINNDGINDFNIYYNHGSFTGCQCGSVPSSYGRYFSSLNSSALFSTTSYISCGPGGIGINSVSRFSSNELIKNNNMNWNASANVPLFKSFASCVVGCMGTHYTRYFPWGTCGNWLSSQGDKYISIKIQTGANVYLGWVRLTDGWILKDYAYNSIPNQPILTGETSCTNPTVNLTQSGSLTFCAGDSVVLTANGTGYQYQWKKNNVNIAGATSKTYTAKTAGVYKCKVTNSCGSKTSGTRTVTVPCRLTNESITETLEQLLVFPNPATNSVTIKFPSDEAGEIQIVNLFGQVIYKQNLRGLENLEGLYEIKIDVSKFSEGMYVARWNSGENFETKTFSVIK